MAWNRKQSIEVCKRILAAVSVTPTTLVSCSSWPEIIKDFESYRRSTYPHPADRYEICYDDGAIFLNGRFAFRIAAKEPKVAFDEKVYYWEGRCLAKGEEE